MLLLAFWGVQYVLLDGLTTIWLIYTNGISGELMPLASSIYFTAGVGGLLFAKLAAATAYDLAIIGIDHAFRTSHAIKKLIDYVLLAFIGVSSFVGFNNLAGVVAIQLSAPDLLKSPSLSILPLILAITFAYGAAKYRRPKSLCS